MNSASTVKLRLGDNLFINPESFELDYRKHLVLDCETDEKNNFVGIAVCQESDKVYYFTQLFPDIVKYLERCKLVGHSLKGDMRWLHEWGVKIKPEQLEYDTILASYVRNSTKASHGLKPLCKEILGVEWSSYQEMVHPDPEHPKKKVTLDKQPVERVASYCAMDALMTLCLSEWFKRHLTETENSLLRDLEIPTARVLLKMELSGVRLDIPYLKGLKVDLDKKLDAMSTNIKGYGVENPNSNKQIAEAIERVCGIQLPLTKKGNKQVNKATLYQHKEHPFIQTLLEYSEVEKLSSTYVNKYLDMNSDKIHCTFNQITKDEDDNDVGITTTRLSSSNPNLQNIPTRTEIGQTVKRAFVPDAGYKFIEADFSQIEPRLIAHLSHDPFLTQHFNKGIDPYLTLSELTGHTRQDCKTFLLALLYGAQAKKLAATFKCSEEEAQRVLSVMAAKMPGMVSFRNRAIFEARKDKGVKTMLGRFIPIPDINTGNRWERMHWERVAVNSKIQGSAAEILKKSLIKLDEENLTPQLTVHDSVLIQVKDESEMMGWGSAVESAYASVVEILESIVTLSVPLKVKVGVGPNWRDINHD
jgi:DNA polymerase-1